MNSTPFLPPSQQIIADIQGGTAQYNFDASDGNWDLTGTTKVNSYSYDVKQSAEKVAVLVPLYTSISPCLVEYDIDIIFPFTF